AQADAHKATVVASFEGRDFALRADVKADLAWNSPYVPRLGGGATGQVVARDFPLRVLHPLVSGAVAELDGKLNAQVSGRLKDGEPVISGRASLSEGRVQLPVLGQQFRDARAQLEWTEAGNVTLKNASFRGVTGRAHVEGSARMDVLVPLSAVFMRQGDRTERIFRL